MPDNRELATAILFAALVIGGLSISAVRRQVPSLLRIAGSLAGLFAIYLATSAALLWVAAQVGLWNTALWWPTGTIVFGVGIGLTAKAIQAKSGHNVWESVPAETVGVTVLIVLYSGLASLPLAWELILQMATALFASVAVVAESQNQAPVKRLCEFALITIGLVFVTTTTIELAHGMSAAQWKLLGQETLMSFWFPFALLPFLYVAAYYSSVEGAAVNVRIRRAKAVRKHPLIARLFIAFRLHIAWANGFDRVWAQRYAEADSRRARSRVLSHYRRTRMAKFRTRRWKRDDSVAQWDGRAMPRNARHIEELLASRPLGWEYLLFGATMWTAMLALEPRYKEYRHRVDRPQPDLDEQEPLERLHSSLGRAVALVERVPEIIDYENQQRVFGAPGLPGDVDAIRSLSANLIRVYEEIMGWSTDLRGASVPSEFRRAFEAAARLTDGPVRQLRGFVMDVALQVDRLPAHLANPEGKQLNIELTVALAVDDSDARRLRRRLARLERRAKPVQRTLQTSE